LDILSTPLIYNSKYYSEFRHHCGKSKKNNNKIVKNPVKNNYFFSFFCLDLPESIDCHTNVEIYLLGVCACNGKMFEPRRLKQVNS